MDPKLAWCSLLLDGRSYLKPQLIPPLEWVVKQFEKDPEKLKESLLQISKMRGFLLFLSLEFECWEMEHF